MYVQIRRAFSNTGRSPRLYPCTPLRLRLARLWQKPPTRSPFFPSRYPLPTVLVSRRANRRNRTEPKFKRWIPPVDFRSLSRDLWIAIFSVSRRAKQSPLSLDQSLVGVAQLALRPRVRCLFKRPAQRTNVHVHRPSAGRTFLELAHGLCTLIVIEVFARPDYRP